MSHQLYACLGSGNCFKAWLAMRQLGIPFSFKVIDVLAGAQKSPEFLAINPAGVVPYLETSSGMGVGESNAVLWYVCDDTKLMPKSAEKRAAALQWMFFKQFKLEPFISPARFSTTILPTMRDERADYIAAWQKKAKPGLECLNEHLGENKFMLGSGYSLADIALFGYTHVTEKAGLPLADYPAIARWKAAVEATPGFRSLSLMAPKDHAKAA